MMSTRPFRILALLFMLAAKVESNDIMVTCNVDEGTRKMDDCTTEVMNDISETLRSCAQLGMEEGYNKADWEIYSLERRNLSFQPERELATCTASCIPPWSACCLLDASICGGMCSNCSCNRRLGVKEEIEDVLANNNMEHAPRRTNEDHRQAVIAGCVAKMEELRARLIDLPTSNLCLGTSFHENKSPSTITCNAYSSEFA
jgi:hypothetical protein